MEEKGGTAGKESGGTGMWASDTIQVTFIE